MNASSRGDVLEGARSLQDEPFVRAIPSPGLADWLAEQNVSLAFSTYQSGHLVLLGRTSEGVVTHDWRGFPHATGLYAEGATLWIASRAQLWRLENALRPGERFEGRFDRLYAPRTAYVVGALDVHELGMDRHRRPVFVNTRYSCLAAPGLRDSFVPVWKPSFITAFAPEDRCHLNGVGFQDGLARYVTVAAASDAAGGWRECTKSGGLVIDVRDHRVLCENLSMPHSPRVHEGRLWVLDSGRGRLVRIDPTNGRKETVCLCPGFPRGLAFLGRYAVVTCSRGRRGPFEGLELEQVLGATGTSAACAVLVIDVEHGEISHRLDLVGGVAELFDVAILRDVACPMALGPDSESLESFVSFEPRVIPVHSA
jgi:uncharacterized protein (TIGR03032 family)